MEVRIGISGWTYAPWRGIFYPKGLSVKQELRYASEHVNSIEINGTFYRIQKPETFQSWYAGTPKGFAFAVKASQYITHRLRAKEADQALANFFASGVLCLKEKLGPILWQFPPIVRLKDDRFSHFMQSLPHSSHAAALLAQKHDKFVEGRAYTKADATFPIRHAFEFRHKSFNAPAFIDEMRENRIAPVIAHAGEHAPGIEDVTTDHVYVRMHGQGAAYEDGYPEAELEAMAARIREWSASPTPPKLISVFFDNDAKACAPRDAARLMQILGINPLK